MPIIFCSSLLVFLHIYQNYYSSSAQSQSHSHSHSNHHIQKNSNLNILSIPYYIVNVNQNAHIITPWLTQNIDMYHIHNNVNHNNSKSKFSENIIIRLFQSIFSLLFQSYHHHLLYFIIMLYLSSLTVTTASSSRTLEPVATKEDIEYLINSGTADNGEYCYDLGNCDYDIWNPAEKGEDGRSTLKCDEGLICIMDCGYGACWNYDIWVHKNAVLIMECQQEGSCQNVQIHGRLAAYVHLQANEANAASTIEVQCPIPEEIEDFAIDGIDSPCVIRGNCTDINGVDHCIDNNIDDSDYMTSTMQRSDYNIDPMFVQLSIFSHYGFTGLDIECDDRLSDVGSCFDGSSSVLVCGDPDDDISTDTCWLDYDEDYDRWKCSDDGIKSKCDLTPSPTTDNHTSGTPSASIGSYNDTDTDPSSGMSGNEGGGQTGGLTQIIEDVLDRDQSVVFLVIIVAILVCACCVLGIAACKCSVKDKKNKNAMAHHELNGNNNNNKPKLFIKCTKKSCLCYYLTCCCCCRCCYCLTCNKNKGRINFGHDSNKRKETEEDTTIDDGSGGGTMHHITVVTEDNLDGINNSTNPRLHVEDISNSADVDIKPAQGRGFGFWGRNKNNHKHKGRRIISPSSHNNLSHTANSVQLGVLSGGNGINNNHMTVHGVHGNVSPNTLSPTQYITSNNMQLSSIDFNHNVAHQYNLNGHNHNHHQDIVNTMHNHQSPNSKPVMQQLQDQRSQSTLTHKTLSRDSGTFDRNDSNNTHSNKTGNKRPSCSHKSHQDGLEEQAANKLYSTKIGTNAAISTPNLTSIGTKSNSNAPRHGHVGHAANPSFDVNANANAFGVYGSTGYEDMDEDYKLALKLQQEQLERAIQGNNFMRKYQKESINLQRTTTPNYDHNNGNTPYNNNGNTMNTVTMTYGHDYNTNTDINQTPLDTQYNNNNNNGNTMTTTGNGVDNNNNNITPTTGGATQTPQQTQRHTIDIDVTQTPNTITLTQGQPQQIEVITAYTPQQTINGNGHGMVPMQITHTTDGGTGTNTGTMEEIPVLDIGGGFVLGHVDDSSSNQSDSASTTSASSSEFDPEHPQHGLSAQDEFSDNDIIYAHHGSGHANNHQQKYIHPHAHNNHHTNANSNASIENIIMHSQFSASD